MKKVLNSVLWSVLQQTQNELNELDEAFQKKRKELIGKKLALAKKVLIKCQSCKKNIQLGKWIFRQDMWYEYPRGCNEGDHWHQTETNMCHLKCPKCGKLNYIYNHPQNKEILALADNLKWGKEDVFFAIEKGEYRD